MNIECVRSETSCPFLVIKYKVTFTLLHLYKVKPDDDLLRKTKHVAIISVNKLFSNKFAYDSIKFPLIQISFLVRRDKNKTIHTNQTTFQIYK